MVQSNSFSAGTYFKTSESDFYRRQILMSKIDSRNKRIKNL